MALLFDLRGSAFGKKWNEGDVVKGIEVAEKGIWKR